MRLARASFVRAARYRRLRIQRHAERAVAYCRASTSSRPLAGEVLIPTGRLSSDRPRPRVAEAFQEGGPRLGDTDCRKVHRHTRSSFAASSAVGYIATMAPRREERRPSPPAWEQTAARKTAGVQARWDSCCAIGADGYSPALERRSERRVEEDLCPAQRAVIERPRLEPTLRSPSKKSRRRQL